MIIRIAVLSSAFLFAGPMMSMADENSNLSDLVQSDVTACTAKALANDFDRGEWFNWPFDCAQRSHNNCTAAALDDKNRESYIGIDRICYDFGRAA